jgi:hypothetical protein
MVGGSWALLERRADGRDTVRIIKPDQALSVRVVKRQRITQPMRPLGGSLPLADLEFQPIALIEPMGTAVKGEEKFERVYIGLIYLSYHYMIIYRQGPGGRAKAKVEGGNFERMHGAEPSRSVARNKPGTQNGKLAAIAPRNRPRRGAIPWCVPDASLLGLNPVPVRPN